MSGAASANPVADALSRRSGTGRYSSLLTMPISEEAEEAKRLVLRLDPEPLKTNGWGLFWTLGAFWMFVYSNDHTPVGDFRLMLDARSAPGEIFKTWQDVEEADDGSDSWSSVIVYRFRLPDGRELTGADRGYNRLRDDLANLEQALPAEVVYHPDDPSLNRLTDRGCHTFSGWLRHTLAFLIMPGVFFLPGILMIRNGAAAIYKANSSRTPVSTEVAGDDEEADWDEEELGELEVSPVEDDPPTRALS